jgi:glycosyltransferase involved in cell wall biosynthesis
VNTLHAVSELAEPYPWQGAQVVHVMGNTTFGGDAFVVDGLCEACSSVGLRPVVLATDPDVVSFMRERGRDVWEFPGIVRPPQPLRDLAASLRLARQLRRRGVQVVHTHTSKGGMVGRLAARLAGCRAVIHHTHGFYHTGLQPGPRRSAMMALETFFGRLDDAQVLMSSEEMRQAMTDGIVPADRARLMFNGVVDPSLTSVDPAAARRLLGVPEGSRVVGTVARLANRQKALDVAIEAFARVAEVREDVYYVIIGEGEDRSILERQVCDLGLEGRVLMPGHLPDARTLLGAMDVVLSTSRREGQSVGLLEAMAWSRPIVATDIAGNRDLFPQGEGALLCPVDDVPATADALSRVLQDASFARDLGRRARERYESTFTREAFVERARELYLDTLTHHWPREAS